MLRSSSATPEPKDNTAKAHLGFETRKKMVVVCRHLPARFACERFASARLPHPTKDKNRTIIYFSFPVCLLLSSPTERKTRS